MPEMPDPGEHRGSAVRASAAAINYFLSAAVRIDRLGGATGPLRATTTTHAITGVRLAALDGCRPGGATSPLRATTTAHAIAGVRVAAFKSRRLCK
jgi:hypothetical protein